MPEYPAEAQSGFRIRSCACDRRRPVPCPRACGTTEHDKLDIGLIQERDPERQQRESPEIVLDTQRGIPCSRELPRARPSHDAEGSETIQSALNGKQALHRETSGRVAGRGANPETRLQQIALAERGDAQRKDTVKPGEVEISPGKPRGRVLERDIQSVLQYEIERDRLGSDPEVEAQKDLSEKIFERELQRLEISLSTLPSDAKLRIAMTHYPPIGADLKPSRASEILEKHRIDLCVFGHLHNVKSKSLPFGTKNGVRYVLASSDYIHFKPINVMGSASQKS